MKPERGFPEGGYAMGRVAVVTGGTRGIGHAIAIRLKAAGHKVAATYVGNEQAAQAFHAETGIAVFKFDVGHYPEVEAGIRQIESALGPVEILVNNAGVTKDGFLHKMSPEQWAAVIDTNLTSCFNLCRAVVPGMRERGFGRIVNIGSINGQKGQIGQTNYAAAKAGMIGFTKSLALESAAKGITVNIVCPGYIETDMTANVREDVLKSIIAQIPVGHMGKPSDVADAVAYLADDKAGFITGSTLTLNGAQYLT